MMSVPSHTNPEVQRPRAKERQSSTTAASLPATMDNSAGPSSAVQSDNSAGPSAVVQPGNSAGPSAAVQPGTHSPSSQTPALEVYLKIVFSFASPPFHFVYLPVAF